MFFAKRFIQLADSNWGMGCRFAESAIGSCMLNSMASQKLMSHSMLEEEMIRMKLLSCMAFWLTVLMSEG